MAEYEFNPEQTKTIGGLGSAMRGVGAFFVLLGLLNIVAAGLQVMAINRNQLPPDVVAKVPADVKAQLEKLPPADHLWGFAINAGVGGLFYLLIGSWTRSAGGDFRKIATTQSSDITHLMNGLGSLRSLYGLIYTLLLLVMLAVVGGIGMVLYSQWKMLQ